MKQAGQADSLEGKVALITGATSGVGRATALGFAARGANVVATGRRDALGKELETDATVEPGDLHFVQADVRSVTDCDRAVSEAVGRFGQLDAVLCCAGVESQIADFHALTEEEWDRVVDTNLKGTAFTCRAAIPHMLGRGGVILNIASINAVGGIAHMAPYNASKAGVVQLTRTLAVEYLTAGIRANSIILGGAEGETGDRSKLGFARYMRGEDYVYDLSTDVLAGQPAPEIANLLALLCSDEARLLSGASIEVDGTLTAGLALSTMIHMVAGGIWQLA
jgi:NAD(P)-dependent dehydrogenase (short-subunit alcohol dehydrogenase family)